MTFKTISGDDSAAIERYFVSYAGVASLGPVAKSRPSGCTTKSSTHLVRAASSGTVYAEVYRKEVRSGSRNLRTEKLPFMEVGK